jgi:hypothetical protein
VIVQWIQLLKWFLGCVERTKTGNRQEEELTGPPLEMWGQKMALETSGKAPQLQIPWHSPRRRGRLRGLMKLQKPAEKQGKMVSG